MMKYLIAVLIGILICVVCISSGPGLFGQKGDNRKSIEVVVTKQPVKIEPDNEAIASYKRSIDTIPDNKQEHDQIARLRSSGYTPEAWLNKQVQTGRQQIQDRFALQWQDINRSRQQIQDRVALQWQEINRRRRFIGVGEANRMQQELHNRAEPEVLRLNRMQQELNTRAKQEMLQFKQKAQNQMARLKEIDNLGTKGLITNPDEVKWRIVLGHEIESAMFPK